MINRVSGEVSFHDGLYIKPHLPIQSPHRTRKLSLKKWTRHILGSHSSEYGTFEVEALSCEDDCIQVVLLAHQHAFYQIGTPGDAERRAFHEGIISSELGGQKEFSWGQVVCRLDTAPNKDWLVIAYNRQADVPRREKDILLTLFALERIPDKEA
jgi:hypothetical protein